MAEKKKQHYVPKMFMRNFADENKRFSVLHVESSKILEKVYIDSQCFKDYYYGKDLVWENNLGKLEDCWAPVITKICEGQQLNDNELLLIKQFAIYQRQRTLSEGNYKKQQKRAELMEISSMYCDSKGLQYSDQIEEYVNKIAYQAVTPQELLDIAVNAEKMIDDLCVTIIEYDTNAKLISSDAPIILWNTFECHGLGYMCMGLVIFFPISPTKLVTIYDGKMYTRNKGQQYIVSDDENEVHNLNIIQYVNAEKIVLALKTDDFDFVDNTVIEQRKKEREKSPISALGSKDKKMITEQNRGIHLECDLSFALLSHNIHKINYSCREAVPRMWTQEWENKLIMKEEAIPLLAQQMPNMETNIGATRKELKRGCHLMTNFAKQYWSKSN